MARGQGNGQQDDQFRDARGVPERPESPPRISLPSSPRALNAMLVRLLYASRAVDTSQGAIDEILAQSRSHNPACGVTGILCYGGGVFLQAIEGGRMAINELYGHIQRDARHKDVVLLHYEEIS